MIKKSLNKTYKSSKNVIPIRRSKLISFVIAVVILMIIIDPIQCDEFPTPPGFAFTGIHGELGGLPDLPTIIIFRRPKPQLLARTGFVFVRPEWTHPWWPTHIKKKVF